MNNSLKDKLNWTVLVISVIVLIIMVIGISAGFNLLGVTSIIGVIFSLILQGMIPVVLFLHIKRKGESIKLRTIRKTIITLSLFSLLLLMLSGTFGIFYASGTLSLISQVLFFLPDITIIAAIFVKEYKKVKREFVSPLLFVLYDLPVYFGAILSLLVLIFGSVDPLFGLFTVVIFEYFILLLTVLLFAFLPCFIISFFVVNWDDRSQLLDKKIYLYLSSTLLSVIAGFLLPIFVMWILAIPFSILLKFLFLKRIPRKEMGDKLVKLEEGIDLLEVKDLKVYYPLTGGFLKRQIGSVKAVDGVSLKIKSGQTVGLVGESGCGKSTLAKAVLGIQEIESGEIKFQGEAIELENYPRELREKIQIVYQDPDASLNPRKKAIDIVTEPLRNLYGITDKKKLRKNALRLLNDVSLKREHLDRYPDEFSGGQKQRLVIARALATYPQLIILDEPTSALDVSVQAQILNLLKDLQKKYNYGYLFITHNLAVVQHIADHVAVMYLGRVVEIGSSEQIFSRPTHPYTQALLNSDIKIDPDDQAIKFVIEGEVPSPINPPKGCHFNPRCVSDARTKECEFASPHMIKVEDNHFIWCVNEPEDLKY